jgi:5-methyltetrahydropteroyltriglutamate--homocysteine methyltransferase
VEARAKFAKAKIDRKELEALERRATAFWITTQEEIGLDVLVDGEMYRGDMVAYFSQLMPGFEQSGLVRSYGNRYYHKPIIVGDVRWPGPMTVEWWRYAQGLTQRPVKGMLTGPYTVMDWSFNEHYSDRRSACLALAGEIRHEVVALLEAGAKIIQIDEPALSVRPEELPFAIEAIHVVTDELPAYFIIHACYGAFDAIYSQMLKLPVDNLDLAISHSTLNLMEMFRRDPFTKDLSLGVLDVHSHDVETPETIRSRIEKGLQLLPKETIWVDPDCGLKTRTIDEARGKLVNMLEAVTRLRSEIGAR